MERPVLRRSARPQRHLSLAENAASITLQQLERIRSSPLVPIHGMCSRQIALSGAFPGRGAAQRCAAEPGSIVPLALRWAPALRSSVTGRCGACHRARIRATRWHRRENAAPRPGHVGNMLSLPRSDLPVGRFVDRGVESYFCFSEKYFCSHSPQITSRTSGIPPHKRGVS
jgi:hypothetical protein